MLTTYKDKLKGERLEWVDEVPPLNQQDGADVLATMLHTNGRESRDQAERGTRMKAALDKLASLGGINSIPDPLAWQREIRQDRPLPERDNLTCMCLLI